MSQLDLFYRAFTEFKQHTKTNIECVHFRRSAQALKSIENETLTAVFATCTIEEDWILAIEEGLPFVYKAIKEERQFIRNDGEVLPIEKVRKTSKYTIQDLAKHSNYISHEPPEHIQAEVMPDKVLVINKENDYAVYENRVVYALLLYLQEFVASRLNKIKELTNKYEAEATLNKNIVLNNRDLVFEMKLKEIIKDDPTAIKRNKFHSMIERINDIYTNIVALLKTPLMQECSKVDVVSRPITKTNVLRMNNNFRHALQLFEFISEYNKDGYIVNVEEKSFSPLALNISYDYAELINLASFITYLHVNGLTEELKQAYFEEEERRKIEKENILLAKVKKFEKLATAKGQTLNDYLLILDEANKILDRRNEELNALLKQEKLDHEKEINDLNNKHNEEILNLNETHQKEINELNLKHETEINDLNLKHDQEINELNANHALEISTLNEEHNKTINELNAKHSEEVLNLNNEISSLNTKLTDTIKSYEDQINSLNDKHEKEINEINETSKKQIDDITYKKDDVEAELLAFKLQHGIKSDPSEYTSRERFKQLEIEKKHLDKLFTKSWKLVRKEIFKNIMSEKPKKLAKFKKTKEDEEIINEIKEEESLINNDTITSNEINVNETNTQTETNSADEVDMTKINNEVESNSFNDEEKPISQVDDSEIKTKEDVE